MMNGNKLIVILAMLVLLVLPGTAMAADLSVSGKILQNSPVAAFSASPTSGFRPLSVTFTDQSTNSPTSWTWEFRITGTETWTQFSTDQNPTYIFTNSGTYDIRLTVTNSGGSSQEVKTGFITVNANVDFTISGLVNTVPASAIFAKETNAVVVNNVKNQGTDPASNIVVKVYASDVDGGNTAIAETTIASLAAGAQTTLNLVDPTIRTLEGGTVTYTAKVDPDNLIAETNEANNNKASAAKSLKYNGYKGKRYWEGGSDITTKMTFDLNGDVVYYTQPDGAYKGVGWTDRTETWTAANLPIPETATVEKALLFFSYNWDQTAGGYPNLVTTFNGNSISLGTPYRDWSNFGTYADYEYGLYPAVDVTSLFIKNGENTLVTTPGNGGADNQVALYPSTLVVIYSDASKTRKQIFINEECDELGVSQSSYGTTMEEATAYAPFTGMTIDTGSVQSATLHSFAGSAGPDEGNLLFNGATVATNAWMGTSSTASAQSFDVKNYLTATGNEAGIQGTTSGGMDALQQILVVEYQAGAPVADFTATPTSGDRPLTVAFTDASTGVISSYAWDFDNDGSTDSTVKNPSWTYNDRGTYAVKLTVTGPGGSDTEIKTDYIVVKEPAPNIDFTYAPASGTAPLTVTFDATNTGGTVTSWTWEYSANGGSTWTQFATTEDTSHTFDSGTYSIRVTATGPDYSDTETKLNIISVGEATISVTVDPATIDFGTMSTSAPSEGTSTVSVDVTGGTGWSVTASANNGGYMKAGALQLADAFQLSNGGAYQYMTSNFGNFLTGNAGEDKNGPANVKQVISSADQPGDYSITLTFTGAFS